jgi:flagellin FlaB
MMGKIGKILRKKNVGSMGIGAMIVFIAMVLVAGIAASVLVQVANTLQMQALYTGQETIQEVATGIAVVDVEGNVTSAANGIEKLTISVRARAGSGEIDLSETIIELADNETKVVLTYDSTQHNTSPASTGVFDTATFNLAADEFGIIVIEDADGSCGTATTPIINKGDLVMLTVATDQTFSPGISERTDIWGNVIPEIGAWGIISFRTPATYIDTVYDLQ